MLKTSFSTTIAIPPLHLHRHRQNKKHMINVIRIAINHFLLFLSLMLLVNQIRVEMLGELKRFLGCPVLVFPKNRGIDFVDCKDGNCFKHQNSCLFKQRQTKGSQLLLPHTPFISILQHCQLHIQCNGLISYKQPQNFFTNLVDDRESGCSKCVCTR